MPCGYLIRRSKLWNLMELKKYTYNEKLFLNCYRPRKIDRYKFDQVFVEFCWIGLSSTSSKKSFWFVFKIQYIVKIYHNREDWTYLIVQKESFSFKRILNNRKIWPYSTKYSNLSTYNYPICNLKINWILKLLRGISKSKGNVRLCCFQSEHINIKPLYMS